MPVKRLNFTNRSKLTREQANVLVHPGQPATFEAVLDLSELPASAGTARVFVEAYHRTTRMRFPFGTVAKVAPPPPHERRLTEFPDWKDVSFRVKVTDVSEEPGRIIAWANNIRPKGPDDDKQNDLVRWKDEDLNGRLWDMNFDDDQGPVVLVEKTVGHANVGQDARFIAVAYPEIFRRSLMQALLFQKESGDDPEHWFTAWTKGYLTSKLGLRPVPDADDIKGRHDWIDEAVTAFGKQFQLADQWLAATGTKGAES